MEDKLTGGRGSRNKEVLFKVGIWTTKNQDGTGSERVTMSQPVLLGARGAGEGLQGTEARKGGNDIFPWHELQS